MSAAIADFYYTKTQKNGQNRMTGLKAQVKKFMKSKGINTITLANGSRVKLQNAKTVDILNAAFKLGF